MNPHDGTPTEAMTRQKTIGNILSTLQTFSPEIHSQVLEHLRAYCPKDHKLSQQAGSLTWIPTRYMGVIATQCLHLLGENRFESFWAQTTFKHLEDGGTGGAFGVFKKHVVRLMAWGVEAIFSMACKNSGDVRSRTGSEPNTVVIAMENIPAECQVHALAVGFGAVCKAILQKAGARNPVVVRTEAGAVNTYRCSWS